MTQPQHRHHLLPFYGLQNADGTDRTPANLLHWSRMSQIMARDYYARARVFAAQGRTLAATIAQDFAAANAERARALLDAAMEPRA
jgi:hypothetical protein